MCDSNPSTNDKSKQPPTAAEQARAVLKRGKEMAEGIAGRAGSFLGALKKKVIQL